MSKSGKRDCLEAMLAIKAEAIAAKHLISR